MCHKSLGVNEKTIFCYVRVFNPLPRCHLHHSIPAVHKKNEKEKKQDYNQQILDNPWIAHTTCVFIFWRNAQGMEPLLLANL